MHESAATPLTVVNGEVLNMEATRWGHRVLPRPLTLPVELGGEALERQRHKQFASSRSHHEWFRPEPSLLDFVQSLAVPDGWEWALR